MIHQPGEKEIRVGSLHSRSWATARLLTGCGSVPSHVRGLMVSDPGTPTPFFSPPQACVASSEPGSCVRSCSRGRQALSCLSLLVVVSSPAAPSGPATRGVCSFPALNWSYKALVQRHVCLSVQSLLYCPLLEGLMWPVHPLNGCGCEIQQSPACGFRGPDAGPIGPHLDGGASSL